jgi:hypothetical protein
VTIVRPSRVDISADILRIVSVVVGVVRAAIFPKLSQ